MKTINNFKILGMLMSVSGSLGGCATSSQFSQKSAVNAEANRKLAQVTGSSSNTSDDPAFTVKSFSPKSVEIGKPTFITIIGSGFDPSTVANLNGEACQETAFVSAEKILCLTSPIANASYELKIKKGNGEVTATEPVSTYEHLSVKVVHPKVTVGESTEFQLVGGVPPYQIQISNGHQTGNTSMVADHDGLVAIKVSDALENEAKTNIYAFNELSSLEIVCDKTIPGIRSNVNWIRSESECKVNIANGSGDYDVFANGERLVVNDLKFEVSSFKQSIAYSPVEFTAVDKITGKQIVSKDEYYFVPSAPSLVKVDLFIKLDAKGLADGEVIFARRSQNTFEQMLFRNNTYDFQQTFLGGGHVGGPESTLSETVSIPDCQEKRGRFKYMNSQCKPLAVIATYDGNASSTSGGDYDVFSIVIDRTNSYSKDAVLPRSWKSNEWAEDSILLLKTRKFETGSETFYDAGKIQRMFGSAKLLKKIELVDVINSPQNSCGYNYDIQFAQDFSSVTFVSRLSPGPYEKSFRGCQPYGRFKYTGNYQSKIGADGIEPAKRHRK